jgi:hypothetical protein
MPKRHAAQPRLEAMEIRLVLSALGAHAPAAQVIAARVAQLDGHTTPRPGGHDIKLNVALRHHHQVKHAHTSHHAGSGSGHHAAKHQSSNFFSNFFNSIFGGGL